MRSSSHTSVGLAAEIDRLKDLLPATGRMRGHITGQPTQSQVMLVTFPWPWRQDWSISLNFPLWLLLPEPQRDLLILRAVCWLQGIRWFRPGWGQGLALVGGLGVLMEATQGDGVGVLVGAGLTLVAARQILQSYRYPGYELQADEAALRVAQRRNYPESEAALHLAAAIQSVADLENRNHLSFLELLRVQNLEALAGRPVPGVPQAWRTTQMPKTHP